MKECAVCRQVKPVSEFYADKSRKDGVARLCKACNSAKNKDRYHANREDSLAKARQWRLDNPERARENDRRKYEKNRDRYKARNDAYRVNHPERMAAYKRDWQSHNRERYLAQKRKNQLARLARVKSAGLVGIFTVEQMNARIAYYGGKCWICKTAAWEALDHVKPLSRGGAHVLSNIRPACTACNSAKGNKWPFALAA